MTEEKNVGDVVSTIVEKAEIMPLNLEALIKMGTVEKELEPMPGMKITMHALLQSERESVAKLMPLSSNEVEKNSFYTASEVEKVPALTYAITAINGVEYKTPDQKTLLRSQLLQIPSISLDLIYLSYSKLCVEQLGILAEGIKKKS